MRESKILHISKDQKFINAASYLFEKAFPGGNQFVVVKSHKNSPTEYIGKEVNAQYEIRSDDTVSKLVEMSNKHHVTVFHGIDQLKGAVYKQATDKNRFMTIVYGAEIYNRPEIIGEDLIGEKSKKLFETTREKSIVDHFKDIYRSVAYKSYSDVDHIDISGVLYKMNVFGSLPSFSYKRFIENDIYNPSVQRIPFSYYPIEFIIKDESLRANGSDILLGNSAWPTNNHIEAFEFLKKLNLNGRTIFAPLSYGPKKYTNAIVSHGQKLFPENFKPLTEFLPLKEYNEIISRCGIVIMNHYRPQAMGNIFASLYMGAKVFMNKTDAYKYLKRLGCYIYSIEDDLLSQNQEVALKLLTDDHVEHNREVLESELSTQFLVQRMRKSFKEIFGFTNKQVKTFQ